MAGRREKMRVVKKYEFNKCECFRDSAVLIVKRKDQNKSVCIDKDFLECFFDIPMNQVLEVLNIGRACLTQLRNWYGLARWPTRLVGQTNFGKMYVVKKRGMMIQKMKRRNKILKDILLLAHETAMNYDTILAGPTDNTISPGEEGMFKDFLQKYASDKHLWDNFFDDLSVEDFEHMFPVA